MTEENPQSLDLIGTATRMLAEAKSLPDVRNIRDLATAAAAYARAHALGLEAVSHATEIRLRAERKGGEILRQMKPDKQRDPGPAATDVHPREWRV
jgi:hypothetical protein